MGVKVDRQCPVCGVSYEADATRLKHGRETTCSRACSYSLRGAKSKTVAVTMDCPVCGVEFDRRPNARHGHHYCSRACHYKGRTLGLTARVVERPYQYTAGGMTRLRRAGARQYASGAVGFPASELALVDRLVAARVDFVHQHVVDVPGGAYAVDFYFPRLALVIELDGDEHQKPDAVESDRVRDARLADMGLRVVRVRDGADDSNAERVGAAIGVKL